MADTIKHTPGPWKIANSGYANAPSVIYVGDKHPDFGHRYPLQGVDWIAEVKEDESPRGREYHANTRLIAAAPDLLEALQSLTQQVRISNAIDDHGHELDNLKAMADAEAALRKAEGK